MALAKINIHQSSLSEAEISEEHSKYKTNVGNGFYTKELLTINTFLLKIKHNQSTKAKTIPKPTNPTYPLILSNPVQDKK